MIQPLIIPIDDNGSEAYQLYEEWSFWWRGVQHVVPKGFILDGASVPRLLWPVMPPDGLHRAASVAHDWVFVHKGILQGGRFTLGQADCLFYRLLLKAGKPVWYSRLIFVALRTGSWYTWKTSKVQPRIEPIQFRAFSKTKRKNLITRHLYDEIKV